MISVLSMPDNLLMPCLLNDRTVFDNVAQSLEVIGYDTQDPGRRFQVALAKGGAEQGVVLFRHAARW